MLTAAALSHIRTTTTVGIVRTYTSRAHPRPPVVYTVHQALETLQRDVARRQRNRQRKWQRNQERQGVKMDSTMNTTESSSCPHPDETIDIALNLNVDPRKPGQSLRGTLSLPHGTGKTLRVAVLTNDEDLQERARMAGATFVGGNGLVTELADECCAISKSYDPLLEMRGKVSFLFVH